MFPVDVDVGEVFRLVSAQTRGAFHGAFLLRCMSFLIHFRFLGVRNVTIKKGPDALKQGTWTSTPNPIRTDNLRFRRKFRVQTVVGKPLKFSDMSVPFRNNSASISVKSALF